MKVRLGFVTNSSSSSFIISNVSFRGELCIESIFRYICEILEEVKKIGEQLICEADNRGISNFVEDYIYGDKRDDPQDIWEYCSQDLGVEHDDLIDAYKFVDKQNWILRSANYEEYLEVRNIQYPCDEEYPFIIISHMNQNKDNIYYSEWVVDYYNSTRNLKATKAKELGEIGVYSQDGWLPRYITDRLEEISAYSSLHMG